MKLAEALIQRSEYQKKIDNLQQRIIANLKVQEKEKPHENPEILLAESARLNEEMNTLIKRINRKNSEVKFDENRTLADALADRDMLIKKRRTLMSIVDSASQKDYRLTHAEIKMYVTLDISDIQKQIDNISMQYRELDTLIQGKNWTIDL